MKHVSTSVIKRPSVGKNPTKIYVDYVSNDYVIYLCKHTQRHTYRYMVGYWVSFSESQKKYQIFNKYFIYLFIFLMKSSASHAWRLTLFFLHNWVLPLPGFSQGVWGSCWRLCAPEQQYFTWVSTGEGLRPVLITSAHSFVFCSPQIFIRWWQNAVKYQIVCRLPRWQCCCTWIVNVRRGLWISWKYLAVQIWQRKVKLVVLILDIIDGTTGMLTTSLI